MQNIISKAELSRQLGVSKARVSQLISSGLPVRRDGSIDRQAALEWIKSYVSSPNGGGRRQSFTGVYDAACRLLGATAADESWGIDPVFYPVTNISVIAGDVWRHVGKVLVGHGIPAARELTDEIVAEALSAAAIYCDELVAEEEIPEPPDGGSWSDHPWFQHLPVPDADWKNVEPASTAR